MNKKDIMNKEEMTIYDSILPVMVTNNSSKYMRYTLSIAKKNIPSLVILSDKPQISYFNAELYNSNNQQVAEFSKNYHHLSANSYDYELFCFNRWFYIYEYARKNGYDAVVHFDTDVFICEPGKILFDAFAQKTLCLSNNSGHSGYFHIDTLQAFCDFLLDFGKTGYQEYEELTRKKLARGIPWGICDMNALGSFYTLCQGSKSNLQPGISANINDANGYQGNEDTKMADIFMHNGHVCLKNKTQNSFENFLTIHFQGPAKAHVMSFFHFYLKHENKQNNSYIPYQSYSKYGKEFYRITDSGRFKWKKLMRTICSR